jgi:hypothetical protein
MSRSAASAAGTVRPDALFNPTVPAAALVAATAEVMEVFGHEFGARARVRDVLLLQGGLGVGKTAFARGFVRGESGVHMAHVSLAAARKGRGGWLVRPRERVTATDTAAAARHLARPLHRRIVAQAPVGTRAWR